MTNPKQMIDYYIKREVLDGRTHFNSTLPYQIYERHKRNIKNILHMDSCMYEYAMKKISRKMGI